MTTQTGPYASYDEAAQAYLASFRALRNAPPAPAEVTTRGAGEVAADTLIASADAIADVSAAMVPLAGDYLDSPDPALREGISGQLLAQAAAELQVAGELLEIAQEEPDVASGPTTRAARGSGLRAAINSLEQSMAIPLSEGLLPPSRARRGGAAADTPEGAKEALKNAAIVTSAAITQRVSEVGGDMAFNLVFNTEWGAVVESAGLLNKDVARLLEQIKTGAGAVVQRALAAAAKTLVNAYDKILALLGKDVEDEARQRIKSWLEDIKNQGKIELFDQLLGKLYHVNEFKARLDSWLEETEAGVEQINTATGAVTVLSDKFVVFVGHLNTVGDVVGLARFIKLPQVLVIVTGIRVALLAVLVYAGYDYLGYKEPRFPNLTKGIGEVVKEGLAVAT